MPNKQNRITIAGTLYHQVSGTNPTAIPLRCTIHPLLSSEQVYSRTPPDGIGPEWEPLSFGWVEKCSVLYLRNNEVVDPKDTEQWKEKSIMLGWTEDHPDPIAISLPFRVPPGMVSLLYPVSSRAKFLVKSGGADSVKYTLFALPG